MFDLGDYLTIAAQRIISSRLITRKLFIDIWQTPTGFTGGNMRYRDDATVKPLPPSPGDVFKVIEPVTCIVVVDDNLDFQVMSVEDYEAMKSMFPEKVIPIPVVKRTIPGIMVSELIEVQPMYGHTTNGI